MESSPKGASAPKLRDRVEESVRSEMASLLRVSIFLLAMATAAYCLPANFQFGMATASYQVEGAWNISRGLSIWDTFSHTPGKVADGATGDVADDFYHKYYNDIKLMHQYGITHFRLSISWSRIMRTGSGPVNPEGIAFYNGLINALLASGITPAVTLFHWDMPQGLEDAYGSWLDDQIIPDFTAYADACFGAFGDRVKYWFTFNEPLTFANLGYGTGGNAPGRCSDRSRCSAGNSTTEPWIVGHRVILAHASAYALYQSKYKSIQGGKVGIVLNSDWAEPYTSSADDVYAAQCALDYSLGWWADPIWYGDYPHAMKEQLGSLLPRFTPTEKIFIKGSYDFFALNHYTSRYVSSVNRTVANPAGTRFHDRNPQGVPIGPVAESSWLIVVPWGFEKLLDYVWNRYFTPIVVTENGVDVPGENSMPIKEALHDEFRVKYYTDYLAAMQRSMAKGTQVFGYYAWSFMDNFEWADGYSKRFGVTYVDYTSPTLERYPKDSAHYLSDFFRNWN